MRQAKWFVLVAMIALGAGALLFIPRGDAAPKLVGTLLHNRPSPAFKLTNQFGHTVSLSSLRGRAVVLTFLESHCTGNCPLVAEELRRATSSLGPDDQRVALVAISVDPEGDTAASVRRFSIIHHLYHRWDYLTGTRRQLQPVWRSFYVYAAPKGASPTADQAHTSATYLIDQTGHERVLMTGSLSEPAVSSDLRSILGLGQASQAQLGQPAPLSGHPAPPFGLKSVNGATVTLRQLRGQIVVLNFWATWCTVCRSEMPRLERQYHRMGSHHVMVIGVDQEESAGDVLAFTRKLGISYPLLLDSNGVISARYDVVYLPTTFLIDRQGVIENKHVGALGSAYFHSVVRPLVQAHSR